VKCTVPEKIYYPDLFNSPVFSSCIVHKSTLSDAHHYNSITRYENLRQKTTTVIEHIIQHNKAQIPSRQLSRFVSRTFDMARSADFVADFPRAL